jgi:hypothetical protein
MKIKDYKKLNNVTALKKAHAKCRRWCHLYIRLRDLQKLSDGRIIGKDIGTGKVWEAVLFSDKSIMNGKEWHASHYWNADKYASVMYDVRNLNGQLSYNNRQQHGDKTNYEVGLRKKIGDKEFESLKIDKNKVKHWDIIELEKLSDVYKLKAQLEVNRLQIKI